MRQRVQRVAYRVKADGYPVAENKIRQGYPRLWALVAEAIVRCSKPPSRTPAASRAPRIVAQMTGGR